MNKEKSVIQFLHDLAGPSCEIQMGHPTGQDKLPRYLKALFEFFDGIISGINVTYAISREKEEGLSALDVGRQSELLKKVKGRIPVFVFDRIRSDTARRLIERKIAFIEMNRQIYLPFLLLKLHTAAKKPSEAFRKVDELGSWAQGLVIRQLIENDLDQLNGRQIASKLGLGQMTVSRSIEQLERTELCSIKFVGKSKVIEFKKRAALWNLAQNHLRSPIERVADLDRIPQGLTLIESGETALAARSMLAEPPIKTYAIFTRELPKKTFNDLASYGEIVCRLELWNRDPKITSASGIVDPISLFLILKNEPDERVQIALEKMMQNLDLISPERQGK